VEPPSTRLNRVRQGLRRMEDAGIRRAPGVALLAKHSLRRPQSWVGPSRLRLRDLRHFETLVPVRAFERKVDQALDALLATSPRDAIGDYLEFGVSFGTSMAAVHRRVTRRGLTEMRLFGFDSFEGLPDVAAHDDDEGMWPPGTFRSDIDLTRKLLALQGLDIGAVTLVPGWFDATLTDAVALEHGISHAGIVMIDCDIYTSAKEALAFCAPLLGDAAVLMFDDWHAGDLANRGLGEKRAFEELLVARPEFESQPLGGYHAASEVFLLLRR
jgi:O-methyltransferase